MEKAARVYGSALPVTLQAIGKWQRLRAHQWTTEEKDMFAFGVVRITVPKVTICDGQRLTAIGPRRYRERLGEAWVV